MGNTQAIWKPLAPLRLQEYSNAVLIDNKYILFVADNNANNVDTNGIIVYDIKNDDYPSQMKKEHPKNTFFHGPSISYNPADKLVYVFGGKDKCFMTYDVSGGKWFAIVDQSTSAEIAHIMNVKYVDKYPGIIFDSHGTLHVVAGGFSNKHYIYNEGQQKFRLNFQFPFTNNYCFGLASDTINNRLIMFGGKSGGNINAIFGDDIGFFDLTSGKWKMSDLKLDIPLGSFGFVFLDCIQLIIIFGGYSTGDTINDNIRFVDLLKEKVSPSNIKCPLPGGNYAVLVHDKKNSKLIIHLFQWTGTTHWSIDLFHILPLIYHQQVCKHYNLSAVVYQSIAYAAEEKKEERADDNVMINGANNNNVPGVVSNDNSGKSVSNDLPMNQQSFAIYFYETVKSADKYYQTFVDKEFNDLDILMEFESSDLSVLMDECHMNRMHAKHLLKNIKVLKESNEHFQQWLMSLEMKRKYYKHMIAAGIATLEMLEQRFVCVTDFVIFLGGENDDKIEMDGVCIWKNMPKNSKQKGSNNNNEIDNSVMVGNDIGIHNISYDNEGEEGITVTSK